MKRHFAAVFAAACLIGSSGPGFAASSGGAHRTRATPPIIGEQGVPPRLPNLQSRIPAPLPPPPQAPVINGPLSPTGLPPMGGARWP